MLNHGKKPVLLAVGLTAILLGSASSQAAKLSYRKLAGAILSADSNSVTIELPSGRREKIPRDAIVSPLAEKPLLGQQVSLLYDPSLLNPTWRTRFTAEPPRELVEEVPAKIYVGPKKDQETN